METVWRMVTRTQAPTAFSGEGARLYGGRWNKKGERVVYTAQHRSLSLLEMMVQDKTLQAHYLLIPAFIPHGLPRQRITAAQLSADWRTLEGRPALAGLGSQWLREGQSCLLEVPSAVLPAEYNLLLNPLHPDFPQITTGPFEPLETDLRLLRNRTEKVGAE